MQALFVYFALISVITGLICQESYEIIQPSAPELVYAITLAGTIYAISVKTGDIFWTKEGPSIVSVDQKAGKNVDVRPFLIPNPIDGSLYSFIQLGKNSPGLKDLSLNIQKLVGLSPVSAPNEILQLGLKKDVWQELDPYTGSTYSTVGNGFDHASDSSLKPANPLILSTTLYRLILYNRDIKDLVLNISFNEYNFDPLELNSFDYIFLNSPSGLFAAVHKLTWFVPWKIRLDSPVIHVFKTFDHSTSRFHLYHVSDNYILKLAVGEPTVNSVPVLSTFFNLPTLHGDYIYALKTYYPSRPRDYLIESLEPSSNILEPYSPQKTKIQLYSPDTAETSLTFFNKYLEIIRGIHTDTSVIEPAKPIKWRYIFMSYTLILTLLVSISTFCIFVYIFPIRYDSIFKTLIPVPEHFSTVGKIHFNPCGPLAPSVANLPPRIFEGIFENRYVAVKRMPFDQSTIVKCEIKAFTASDGHPNLIRYFCTEEDAEFYYIAVELCSNDLQVFVTDKTVERFGLDEREVLRHTTRGLDHLHSIGIVHRRLKPQNVLISKPGSDGCARVVITDFGVQTQLNKALSENSYLAPELKEKDDHTFAADIFALGCLFHFVLSAGRYPFVEQNNSIYVDLSGITVAACNTSF